MSRAVLISIRPKWCELIASGKKTIEVRKSRPKLETPFKCYIYCTKPSFPHEDFFVFDAGTDKAKAFYGGGKVIGEFVCDCIKHYITLRSPNFSTFYMKVEKPGVASEINFTETCLTEKDFFEYASGKDLFGWHISELKIYDKPKALREFRRHDPTYDFSVFGEVCRTYAIQRPPQSWVYVEELE